MKMGRETEEGEFTRAVPSVQRTSSKVICNVCNFEEIITFSLVISRALESKLYYLHSCNVFTILGCIFLMCLMQF